MITRFPLGARVVRPRNVFKIMSSLMHGEVVAIYGEDAAWPWTDPPGYVRENNRPGLWRYPELYDVQWDDGRIDHGFLPHGLDPEET